jgi:ADP-ribosylation factor 6
MAAFLRQVARVFGASGPIETRILMLGLDGGGSTRLLYALHRGVEADFRPMPTIGFNLETINLGGTGTPLTRDSGGGLALNLTAQSDPDGSTEGFGVGDNLPAVEASLWDVGGQERIRPLFRHYLPETKLLLFVVDSADPERLPEALTELKIILGHTNQSGQAADEDMPVLLVAAKQDLDGALTPQQVSEEMGLEDVLEGRLWYALGVSASTGAGLDDLRDWITAVTSGVGLARSGTPGAGRMVKSANKS